LPTNEASSGSHDQPIRPLECPHDPPTDAASQKRGCSFVGPGQACHHSCCYWGMGLSSTLQVRGEIRPIGRVSAIRSTTRHSARISLGALLSGSSSIAVRPDTAAPTKAAQLMIATGATGTPSAAELHRASACRQVRRSPHSPSHAALSRAQRPLAFRSASARQAGVPRGSVDALPAAPECTSG